MGSYAGTVTFLLCAAIHNRLLLDQNEKKEREEEFGITDFYVGHLKQHPEDFFLYPAAHQRERIAFTIRDEAYYWRSIHTELLL